jgi:hypothetical protein
MKISCTIQIKNKNTNLAALQSWPAEQQSLHLSHLAMEGPEMAGGAENSSEALGLVGCWQSPSKSSMHVADVEFSFEDFEDNLTLGVLRLCELAMLCRKLG